MRVEKLCLRSSDVQASHAFLDNHFPAFNEPRSIGPAGIRFLGSTALPSPIGGDHGDASFWKFSVFCDDVDRTRFALLEAGTDVTEPVQFGDIGYLCHLVEPGGNAVELLQRSFNTSPSPVATAPDSFGLITLRVTDPDASHRFYANGLGLRLLATMAVDDGRPDPFDLYFYGDGATAPPDPDPSAVSNREWLYQRPFTVIELQHYRNAAHHPAEAISSIGLHSIHLVVENLEEAASRLAGTDCSVVRSDGPDGRPQIHFDSPDGHRYVCTQQD